MEFWMIYVLVAIIAVVFEALIPTVFCINFAFAGILTAIISIFWGTTVSLLWTFFALSIISIIFVKPKIEKVLKKEDKADFDSQYIGKIVKCTETITKTTGAVSIYDERWDARLLPETEEEISVGSDVKIIKNNSTILYVEKV